MPVFSSFIFCEFKYFLVNRIPRYTIISNKYLKKAGAELSWAKLSYIAKLSQASAPVLAEITFISDSPQNKNLTFEIYVHNKH